MDLYEAIKGRRSVRRFKPNPLPKEVLERNIQSVAAAIQNLLLSAYADGLGACWMTGPVHVAVQINEFLSICDKILVAIIPIGYPDESPPFPKRKPNRVVYEGF
jgi:nitroreductase